MANYLLDTTVLIDCLRGKSEAVEFLCRIAAEGSVAGCCPINIVEVYGGVRKKPLTINIEKINVKKIVDRHKKLENPVCPKCKKHMKSKGKNMGYKCLKCKTTKFDPVFVKIKRDLEQGFYEVPVCARRHLSKPLKRF